MQREHLRSPSCWCQEYQLLIQRHEGLDNSASKRGLTRTSSSTEDHHDMLLTIGHEEREHVEGMFLFLSRYQAEGLENTVFQLVLNHFDHKDNDYLRFIISVLPFFFGGSNFFTLHSSLFTFIFVPLHPNAEIRQGYQHHPGACGTWLGRLVLCQRDELRNDSYGGDTGQEDDHSHREEHPLVHRARPHRQGTPLQPRALRGERRHLHGRQPAGGPEDSPIGSRASETRAGDG